MEITEIEKKRGKWLYQRKEIIEEDDWKKEIIRLCYDDEQTGHPGFKETLRKVYEVVYWDIMRKDIMKYVQQCETCQKERETKKIGLGEEVGRPEKIWQKVSIDHITKLSRVGGKDSILMIQDQLSGMIHLKAVSENEDTKRVWQDCKDTAWKLHGYPRIIQTGRETIFTSKTWEKFEEEQGIEHRKTTVYHSQEWTSEASE